MSDLTGTGRDVREVADTSRVRLFDSAECVAGEPGFQFLARVDDMRVLREFGMLQRFLVSCRQKVVAIDDPRLTRAAPAHERAWCLAQ